MIKSEIVKIDGERFIRTVSDTYRIRKIGTDEIYSEAYDLPEKEYEYEETEELLKEKELL